MQILSAEYSRAAVHADSITGEKRYDRYSSKPTYVCRKCQAKLILQMNLAGLINKC